MAVSELVAPGDLVYVKWPAIHRRGWVIVLAVTGRWPGRRFQVLTPDGRGEATEQEVHGWRPG